MEKDIKRLAQQTNTDNCYHFIILLALFILPLSHTKQITYSAHDHKGVPLDLKLVEIMGFDNGIFVEVGAYDGLRSSNTKLLEECYGWTGILIEPSKKIMNDLAASYEVSTNLLPMSFAQNP